MLASGSLSPLEGFMGQADYDRVVEEMHLVNDLPWALPVCLAVDAAPSGERVVLADEAGSPVAVLEVEEVFATTRSGRPRTASGRPTTRIPESRASTHRSRSISRGA